MIELFFGLNVVLKERVFFLIFVNFWFEKDIESFLFLGYVLSVWLFI